MSNANGNSDRPLSPHLTIYKPIPTMVVSILHRLTGAALYLGTLLLAWWLIAAASGEIYFSYVSSILGSVPGKIVLFGFTFALIQHLLGGVKHLFWDVGLGFDKEFATKIAIVSLIASSLITLAVWYLALWAQ